jgi:hypothetical protein
VEADYVLLMHRLLYGMMGDFVPYGFVYMEEEEGWRTESEGVSF